MRTNQGQGAPPPTDSGALELTTAEIRGVLFEVARGHLDERAARHAIRAFNRIMCDASRLSLTPAAGGAHNLR